MFYLFNGILLSVLLHVLQVLLVLEILERHPKLPLLVVSDSDTVWLRQPWTYFDQRPAADFFISTDCNSIEASAPCCGVCAAVLCCAARCTALRCQLFLPALPADSSCTWLRHKR